MSRYVFTSESVTEGHPDKICDQVSDAVLDALLAQDPSSRVACETVVNTGLCMITGEVTSKAQVDFIHLVRNVIKEIGYSGAIKRITKLKLLQTFSPRNPSLEHRPISILELEALRRNLVAKMEHQLQKQPYQSSTKEQIRPMLLPFR